MIGGGEEWFDGDHHQNTFPLYPHPWHIIIPDQLIFSPMSAPPWSEHQSAAPHGTTITPVSSIVIGKISHDPLMIRNAITTHPLCYPYVLSPFVICFPFWLSLFSHFGTSLFPAWSVHTTLPYTLQYIYPVGIRCTSPDLISQDSPRLLPKNSVDPRTPLVPLSSLLLSYPLSGTSRLNKSHSSTLQWNPFTSSLVLCCANLCRLPDSHHPHVIAYFCLVVTSLALT